MILYYLSLLYIVYYVILYIILLYIGTLRDHVIPGAKLLYCAPVWSVSGPSQTRLVYTMM